MKYALNRNVCCIRHPRYSGDVIPDLNCETCCSLYLQMLKLEQEEPGRAAVNGEALKPQQARQTMYDLFLDI